MTASAAQTLPLALPSDDAGPRHADSAPLSVTYRTFGRRRAEGRTVLLFTYYTGTHDSYLPWIGSGRPLDPEHDLVVVVDHLGGGVSSSPSNHPTPFPPLALGDTVRAAEAVLGHLGVDRVALVAGWSLGGMLALDFAATRPDLVEAVFALCSAARCAPVNRVFLDSVAAALAADPAYPASAGGAAPRAGLDAFGRVYAGWAYSEEFFDDGIHREFGYADAADVLARWGEEHRHLDADDLMASLTMWRDADLGVGRGGLAAALGVIRARTVLMPASSDRYFTVAENRRTLPLLPHGELRILDSPLGHIAGRPGIRRREQDAVDETLRALLTR